MNIPDAVKMGPYIISWGHSLFFGFVQDKFCLSINNLDITLHFQVLIGLFLIIIGQHPLLKFLLVGLSTAEFILKILFYFFLCLVIERFDLIYLVHIKDIIISNLLKKFK